MPEEDTSQPTKEAREVPNENFRAGIIFLLLAWTGLGYHIFRIVVILNPFFFFNTFSERFLYTCNFQEVDEYLRSLGSIFCAFLAALHLRQKRSLLVLALVCYAVLGISALPHGVVHFVSFSVLTILLVGGLFRKYSVRYTYKWLVIIGLVYLQYFGVPSIDRIPAPVSRIREDIRQLAVAIENYKVDTGRYPPWTVDTAQQVRFKSRQQLPSFARWKENGQIRTLTTPIAYIQLFHQDSSYFDEDRTFLYWASPIRSKLLRQMPPFSQWNESGPTRTLTTPIAYISSLPQDVFSYLDADRTFVYWAPGDKGWILLSAGPDCVFDLDFETLQKVYDPSISQPSPALLHYAYDPTNGSLSRGDLFRVKE